MTQLIAKPRRSDRRKYRAGIISTLRVHAAPWFNAQAGLDIYVVGSSALKKLIDQSKFTPAAAHNDAYEVAEYLGIERRDATDRPVRRRYSGAAIGCSRKHILRLTTPLSRKLDMLYQISLASAPRQRIGIGISLYLRCVV